MLMPWRSSLTPGACRCPRTELALNSSPPATQHPVGGVEGFHEGRALRQGQGKPGMSPAPAAEAAGAQAAAPTQRQRLGAALRTDTTDIITLAETQPGGEDWAHTWTAVHSSALDREGRVTAWRLLHGRLFVGAFLRHIGRGTPESHACPHLGCVGQLASLSHVMLTCAVSQAVW